MVIVIHELKFCIYSGICRQNLWLLDTGMNLLDS